MEQLTQLLKDGTMQILEVPFPALVKGHVLVRNHFSVISSGTEGKTVQDARLGYVGKARSRKDEVKKVITAARTFGIKDTYRMVMNRLNSPSPLGYSCAGEVIAVADDVSEVTIGDRVACGGNSASHAEVVAVPVNLCAKFNPEIPARHAAFTTLGAVAMQGIRQADVRLGESCAIIGLGIIGQLTIQILKAGGIKTIGIDIDQRMVSLADELGCGLALNRNAEGMEQAVLNFTGGHGADAVIITAGSDSTDPVDLAGELCRQKGKVVIVGGVPTGFKRIHYFRKELDLRMSCSYGPGRYDAGYEEHGLDYPIGYVRWTENRNMQAFVDLLQMQNIEMEKLITHTFDFSNAPAAYDLILQKNQPFLGILLQYDVSKELKRNVKLREKKYNPEEVNIGLIGAGSFGQNFLLPALDGLGNFAIVSTARPANARNIAEKFGFAEAAASAEELIANDQVNTVFVATRHDTHARFVLDAVNRNKNVFVEKPLCLIPDELEQIKSAYGQSKARLMLGFNRRFAPMISDLKSAFIKDQPVSINYRINAGIVPPSHWIHDPRTGGGRIIGEACHFIDLCMFIAGSPIKNLSAVSLGSGTLNDTVSIQMVFENGSIASVNYFSNGNKKISKEYLEVFGSGVVAICDDFSQLTITGNKKQKYSGKQDKGHAAEVTAFIKSIREGSPSPIPFEEIYLSTLATFKVIESIAGNGAKMELNF